LTRKWRRACGAGYPREVDARYRQSDLYQRFRAGDLEAVSRIIREGGWHLEHWPTRWQANGAKRKFAAYLEFLDNRNWKITEAGQEIPWLPYPPIFNRDDLRLTSIRIAHS
jgi:hypothetical protein